MTKPIQWPMERVQIEESFWQKNFADSRWHFSARRDLSDLTTTIMGDCTALERVFSNALPQLFGTLFMFIITSIGLLVMDWWMGFCIVIPVPVAALVVFAARKAQANAESANMDAKRAAYDGVQEYLDTIQELKSCSREQEYLAGLEKKLDNVVKCSFHNEIAQAHPQRQRSLYSVSVW